MFLILGNDSVLWHSTERNSAPFIEPKLQLADQAWPLCIFLYSSVYRVLSCHTSSGMRTEPFLHTYVGQCGVKQNENGELNSINMGFCGLLKLHQQKNVSAPEVHTVLINPYHKIKISWLKMNMAQDNFSIISFHANLDVCFKQDDNCIAYILGIISRKLWSWICFPGKFQTRCGHFKCSRHYISLQDHTL